MNFQHGECYVCEKKIELAPAVFSVFYDDEDNDEPKAVCGDCVKKVMKLAKAKWDNSEF